MRFPTLNFWLAVSVLWLAVVGVAPAQSNVHEQALTAYQQQDFQTAFQLWTELADSGDREAQYALGVMYFKGEGRDSDLDKAIEWFDKAARAGHPTAMFNLGVAHWEGKGAAQSNGTAVQWWQKAAQLGDAASQYNLGLAYYLGKGVDKDLERALYWVREASLSDHGGAAEVLPMLEEEYQAEVLAQADETPATAESGTTARQGGAEESAASADAGQSSSTAGSAGQGAAAADAPVQPGPARTADGFQAGLIVADGTQVFSADRSGAPVIETLASDVPVKIVSTSNGWSQIRRAGGFQMWVYGSYVTSVGDSARIDGTNVRARPMPSTGSNSIPIGEFNDGDAVVVIESQGEWTRIRGPEHLGGWVRDDAVRALPTVSQDWEESWRAAAAGAGQ